MNIKRHPQNPIFTPNKENPWEAYASFNGSVIKVGSKYKMLYRAMSENFFVGGADLKLSTIALTESNDGINFGSRKQFIKPENDWEKFGLEDPRVTFLDDKYFIFYTALSSHPPNAGSIKVGLAISKDLETVDEKHLVTPFNAKAMTMFPEKIKGKYVCILTVNTDSPPAKIAVAYFENIEDIWSEPYWRNWYKTIDKVTLPLIWSNLDHAEVGATPVKTPHGWVLVYSYMKDYFTSQRNVQVKAVLLDLENPTKVVGKIKDPLLTPTEDYESKGEVAETIFPTSALINNSELWIYYSGTDSNVSLATVELKDLLPMVQVNNVTPVKFNKFPQNPILTPISTHHWESTAVFNPTAIKLDGKIHLIYRAMSADNTSTFGYAVSKNGVDIEERLANPIYSPTEDFEIKKIPGANSGCEDPRITLLGDKLYICYTAFTGVGDTRVAMTSISVSDFLARKWDAWKKPILITAPGIYDKDACIFPEKIDNKYLFLHRIAPGISVDFSDKLFFGEQNWLRTQSYIVPHPHFWDDEKIGIGPTPIETDVGWLLIYHGISKKDTFYRVGAMLLDLKNPQIVVSRIEYPVLEPTEEFEKINGRGIVGQ